MSNRIWPLVSCLVILALAAPAMAVDYNFPSDNPGKDLHDFYKWAKGLTPSGELRILIANPSTDPANPTTYDDTSVRCDDNMNSKLIFRAANLNNPRPVLRMCMNVVGTAAASKQFAFSNRQTVNEQGLSNSPNPTGILELEHLEMTGIRADGKWGGAGISLTGRFFAGGITVKDCSIHDYADSGIETGEQENTEYAAHEGPTGFVEVLDSVVYHCGASTTHNMYIHANAVVRNTESWGGNQNSDVKIVGRHFEVSGCTLRDTKSPDNPEAVATKSSKLLDIAAFGRGAIFNNTFCKYRPSNKAAAVLGDIIDLRHRKEDIGSSLPPYADPTNIQNEKAYWDMVQAGGTSLADASNPEFYHVFFWNNTFDITNFAGYTGSPKVNVYTNWGTHPGCEWFPKKDQGYSVPFYSQWLERSVMWIADPTITYDTADMGTMYGVLNLTPMRRNVEWKATDGDFDMPGLPCGNLKFVANTSVSGWWNGFSTLPSADAQNPTIPTNLTAVEGTGRRVILKWTRSTDDVAVGGYHIYRNGTEIDMVAVPMFIDTNVANNTSYTYEVEAYDIRNKRSSKASINFSTGTATQRMARDDFQSATSATDGTSGSGWASNWTFTGGAGIADKPSGTCGTYEPDDAVGSGGPADPAPTPSKILRMRGSSTATRTVNLSGAPNNVRMYIQWFKGKLEGTDQAVVEINDGGWHTVLTIDRLSTKDWQIHDAYINLSSYTKSANFQIRITATVSDTDGYFYFDDIELVGTTATMATAPTAPSGLAASAGSSLVSLTWADNSSNEDGFLIERRLTADPDTAYEVLRLVPANTTSWLDRGYETLNHDQAETYWERIGSTWTLIDNPKAKLTTTLYTYRVRAFNQVNWSSYSTASTTGSSAPATPTNLAATPVSATQINLTWTDVATDETGYKVFRATTSNGYNYGSPLATLGANSTSYPDTTCQALTTYYYVVRAYKTAGGDSASSNEASATTPSSGGAPAVVAHDDFENTFPGGYSGEWGGNWSTAGTVQLDTSIKYAGANSLRVGNTTGVATRAVNMTGKTTPVLKLVYRTALFDTTDHAYVEISTNAGSSWNQVLDIGGTAANGVWVMPSDISLSGYTMNSQFQVRIRNVSNAASEYVYIDNIEISAGSSGGAPAAPSNLTLTLQSGTEVQLDWQVNSTDETGFEIERKVGAGSYSLRHTINSAAVDTWTDTGLSASTQYTYRVRAIKSGASPSGYSNEPSVTTPSATPSAPDSLVATADSATEVVLAWNDNSPLVTTHFEIQRKTGAGGTYAVIDNVDAPLTDYTDSGLSANTTYYYKVYACNGALKSGASNEVSVTTEDGKPEAPQSLVATANGSGRIDLVWEDVASDETGFKIERKTGAGSYSEIDSVPVANTESYSDLSCAPNTTYTYRVYSYNGYGNSTSPSNESSATTTAGGNTVAHDDFENGFPGGYSGEWGGSWSTVGTVQLDTAITYAGSNSLRVGNTTGVATRAVNMTGKTNPVLKLVYRTALFDTTDHAYVEISTNAGSSWNQVLDIAGTAANGVWVMPSDISLSGYTMNSQFQVRIRNVSNAASEYVYIDNVEITATSVTTLAFDDLEDGFPNGHSSMWGGSWSGGSSSAYMPHAGGYSLRVRGDAVSGNRESAARAKNLAGISNPTLTFWYRGNGFESTDHAYVEVSTNGTNWTQVFDLTSTLADGSWHQVPPIDLSIYATSGFQVRVRADMDDANEFAYFDDIEIKG